MLSTIQEFCLPGTPQTVINHYNFLIKHHGYSFRRLLEIKIWKKYLDMEKFNKAMDIQESTEPTKKTIVRQITKEEAINELMPSYIMDELRKNLPKG